MSNYKNYFGFKKEPFHNDIDAKDLLKLPNMIAVKERFDYVSNINGIMIVTGDVGSGKSTSLRWALSHYNTSDYLILNIVAHGGAIIEFYRQISNALGDNIMSNSRNTIINNIRNTILEIVKTRKQKILLVVDEAQLLRPEVLAELHVLTQFDNDSKNYMAMVFAGQINILDKLSYRGCLPLASRVIARAHLSEITKDEMNEYVNHHLKIAGVKNNIFEQNAIIAIHQGSAGILRKANALAKGGLIAATIENKNLITAEHIRIASTELI
jgi:type II secretory pathway predicted ATPase ExeA